MIIEYIIEIAQNLLLLRPLRPVQGQEQEVTVLLEEAVKVAATARLEVKAVVPEHIPLNKKVVRKKY